MGHTRVCTITQTCISCEKKIDDLLYSSVHKFTRVIKHDCSWWIVLDRFNVLTFVVWKYTKWVLLSYVCTEYFTVCTCPLPKCARLFRSNEIFNLNVHVLRVEWALLGIWSYARMCLTMNVPMWVCTTAWCLLTNKLLLVHGDALPHEQH